MNLREQVQQAEVALRLGHWDYGLSLCHQVLQVFPGHIRARNLVGQALLEKGLFSEAAENFQRVLESDPENVIARSGLAVSLECQGQLKAAIGEMQQAYEVNPGSVDVREALIALRSKLERVPQGIELTPTALGRVYKRKGLVAKALKTFQGVLRDSPQRLDVQLAHAECLWRAGKPDEAEGVCKQLRAKAPAALKAKLILALILLKRGAPQGVALLHEARTADPSDAVAGPLLRQTDFHIPALEESIDLPDLDLSPPPEVKTAFTTLPSPSQGEGRAGEGEDGEEELPVIPWEAEEAEPSLNEALADFQRLTMQLADRLAPVLHKVKDPKVAASDRGSYVLVTHKDNLIAKYGEQKFALIHRKLEAITAALKEEGYQASLSYLTAPFPGALSHGEGASPSLEGPTQAVDQLLASILPLKDQTMAHVLIVGGDDIVPFHQLSNPTEDDDLLVLSDTPYATLNRDFLSLHRAVGRLPDGGSGDPSFLLASLDSMINAHLKYPAGGNGGLHVLEEVRGFLQGQLHGGVRSFGYTTPVWYPATMALYEAIGQARSLRTSPPVTEETVNPRWFRDTSFMLFNLHGTENSPYWYGQKDETYPPDYPLFPIALGPRNIEHGDFSGCIIFTEACYGAHIVDKDPSESLALQFLKRGASCVAGATRISYGAKEPPLWGSDLLAQRFWLYLAKGCTAGEALTRAKIDFAREVQSRQGYMDGDDQKTVLEYLLLGDPTARLSLRPSLSFQEAEALQTVGPSQGEGSLHAAHHPPSFFCKHRSLAQENVRPPGEVLVRAKRYLQQSFPEASDSQLHVVPRYFCPAQSFLKCSGDCRHSVEKAAAPSSFFVTAHKKISTNGDYIHRVARLTMDQRGTILKMSISK